MRALLTLGCVLVIGLPGCDGSSGASGDPWVPVGTYHLPGAIAVNLRIESDGSFRWGYSNCDNGSRGGGRWHASDGRFVLTPIDSDSTLSWLAYDPGGWVLPDGEFGELEVVAGAQEDEIIVLGVGEQAFGDSSRAYSIKQSWFRGGVCSDCGPCGERALPCDAPPSLQCSPDYDPWCPQPDDPPECRSDQDCDDADLCTEEACDLDEGICVHTPVRCGDRNDCTIETACDSQQGCIAPTPMPDGTPCAGGLCNSGTCELTSSVLPCTEQGIRNAVAAGGGPYRFECDGPTTVVTDAELVIDNDVTLDGEGNLRIDGNGEHRVLHVPKGVTANLAGLSITGGNADGGGGLWNLGALTMTGCTVSGNLAFEGGGIVNQGDGVLSLVQSTVLGNHASRDGGGGIVNLTAAMTITGSTVSANTTTGIGGGILQVGGSETSLTITDSTVSGNRSSGSGGGIQSFAKLTMKNSTVSDNEVGYGNGGGISASGAVALTNSTISGNRALGDCSPNVGNGGGIFMSDETLTTTNTTLSGNVAVNAGGGVYSWWSSTLIFANTLVEGDCAEDPSAELLEGEQVEWISRGGNIESPGDTCGFDQDTDQVSVSADDLRLRPLQDNGGPTETHALLPGSVAIDQIPVADCVDASGEPLTTDQRGESRPGGAMCDVGAFEAQP